MSRLAGALLVALLLAPVAAAQGSDPDYPDDLLALLPGWIEEAEALARAEDRAKPWWPQADEFLAKAKAAADEGRFRITTFHLETFSEVVLANQLLDDTASMGSDAERRSAIAQRTRAWNEDAGGAWLAFRERLHGYDAQLRSLTTIEKALYASDVALTAAVSMDEHDLLSREFAKQGGVPDGYVYALVRASHTPLQAIGWADDVLAAAARGEGLPPRVVDAPWANVTAVALNLTAADAPDFLESLETLAQPARENGEAVLAVAFSLAEQRAIRANNMQTIFGDAEARGLAVVADASRGMSKQLNNTTLDAPRAFGLEGVFTSDAIDRARFTNDFVATGNATLATVLVAWSALEHQSYATSVLGSASPVQPTPMAETPAPGLLLVALALLGAALLIRRA